MHRLNLKVGLVLVALIALFCLLTGRAMASSDTVVDFYDSRGIATAYVDLDDDSTIYLWSGKPVAYIEDDDVYGFNGKHIGWFEDGKIYDNSGYLAGAQESDFAQPVKLAPFKGFKGFKPFKAFKSFAPFKPALIDAWSKNRLLFLLASGEK